MLRALSKSGPRSRLAAKAWCELMGMAGGPVRPGLPQITEKERQALRSELEQTGLLARIPTARAA